MIDVKVRIHDKFSVEFKTGYVVKKDAKDNDFVMNTWIFIPYSLDINSSTYPKSHFYRDTKSYVRLITPIYSLQEVADSNALPFMFLQVAFNELVADPSTENMAEFEYQIKMFTSIAKSALRQECDHLIKAQSPEEREVAVDLYLQRIEAITSSYRELKQIIEQPGVPEQALTYFAFGDEFFSNRIEQKTFEVLESLKIDYPEEYAHLKKKLMGIIQREIEHRLAMGYDVVKKDCPAQNRALIQRLRLLKKYIENHLFLDANRQKDGRLAEQVYFSIAAGVAMIFATTIAFSFQQKYGNFTMPLFVALVVSYMLKDRIKDLIRFYFANHLSKKYFDNKTVISIKNRPIGWIKEGAEFRPGTKVPEEIIKRRGRSDVLESDNRHTEEKIILFRKLVHIDGDALYDNNQYDISGINDIVRFNFSNFIMRMDAPIVPLTIPAENDDYEIILGEHIYYINFLIQLKNDHVIEYKRFRVIVSRNGIEGIDRFQ